MKMVNSGVGGNGLVVQTGYSSCKGLAFGSQYPTSDDLQLPVCKRLQGAAGYYTVCVCVYGYMAMRSLVCQYVWRSEVNNGCFLCSMLYVFRQGSPEPKTPVMASLAGQLALASLCLVSVGIADGLLYPPIFM